MALLATAMCILLSSSGVFINLYFKIIFSFVTNYCKVKKKKYFRVADSSPLLQSNENCGCENYMDTKEKNESKAETV